MNEQLIESVAKALFELHPVSRGAKAWDDQKEGSAYRVSFRSDARDVLRVIEGNTHNPREQWKFLARETHWGHVFLVWTLTGNPRGRNEIGKRFVRWVK